MSKKIDQMSNNEQNECLAGNIQISEAPTDLFTAEDNGYQATKFFFTYHLQGEQFEQAFDKLSGLADICDKYIWGEEYGKSGKTPHIQGAFILSHKMRWSTIEKHYFNNPCPYGKKLKNWNSALKYCCKELNRIESNCKLPKPIKVLDENILYPYQKDVIKYLKTEPNDRDILWIYGTYSIGKTQLAKYLIHHKLAFGPLEGEKRHILSVVAENIHEEAFIMYLTADESIYQKHSFFDCIEKIKDGVFMSHFGTDGTKPVIMNSPHIIVFANKPPDYKKTNMDKNRFIVKYIDEDMKFYNCDTEDENEIIP